MRRQRRPRAGLLLLVAEAAWAAVAAVVTLGAAGARAQVPTVDDLAGDWVVAAKLRDSPVISNFAGSVGTTNFDIADASSFIAPPFVAGE